MKRRHNKIRVAIHFVWTTHERMNLIPEREQRRLWRYVEAVCRSLNCDVLAVGGMPDHVHLLVNFPYTLTLAELMKRVKGGSSVFASEELCGGEWFKWQEHYGAFAVGHADIPRVVEYISQQKRHHADGSTVLEWEEAFEEHDLDDV